MLEITDVRTAVRRICLETLGLANLRDDEDFFDRGASSLTIVELQLRIEEYLGCNVPTSELMLSSSIAGWSDAYATAAAQPTAKYRSSLNAT